MTCLNLHRNHLYNIVFYLLLGMTVFSLSLTAQAIEGQGEFSDLEEILDIELEEQADQDSKMIANPMKYFELRRKRLARNMAVLSNTLDSILGGESLDKEAPSESRIKVTYGQLFEEYEKPSDIFDFSARIALPNTEKRYHLLLESFNEDSREGGTQAVSDSSKLKGDAEERQYNAGLRWIPKATSQFHVSFDAGLKLVWPPQPFAKTRARHRFPLPKEFYFKLVQNVAWYNEEGWETHTQAAFERALSRGKFFSFSNDLFWRDTQNFAEMAHTFSLFHPLTKSFFLTYWAGTLSELGRGLWIKTYEIGVSFRRPVYQDWIYFQISPLGRWQRIHRFTFRSLLEARFEIIIRE